VPERALEYIRRGTPKNFVFASVRGGALKDIHPIPESSFIVYLLGSFFQSASLSAISTTLGLTRIVKRDMPNLSKSAFQICHFSR